MVAGKGVVVGVRGGMCSGGCGEGGGDGDTGGVMWGRERRGRVRVRV